MSRVLDRAALSTSWQGVQAYAAWQEREEAKDRAELAKVCRMVLEHGDPESDVVQDALESGGR